MQASASPLPGFAVAAFRAFFFIFPSSFGSKFEFYSLAGGPAAAGCWRGVSPGGSVLAVCPLLLGHQLPLALPSVRKRRVRVVLHLPWSSDIPPGPGWLLGYPVPTSGTEDGCPWPGWQEDGGVTPCSPRSKQRGSGGLGGAGGPGGFTVGVPQRPAGLSPCPCAGGCKPTSCRLARLRETENAAPRARGFLPRAGRSPRRSAPAKVWLSSPPRTFPSCSAPRGWPGR